jgi:trk system potassium uptake protein TrkH
VAAVGLAALLSGGVPDLGRLRTSAFQVASMSSSTGYASTDFNLWGWGPKAVLLFAMLLGGCAGSASGGPKVIRWILTFKFLRREVTQTLHPQAVLPLGYRGRPVAAPILRAILALVVLYLLGYVLLALALMIVEPGIDLSGALSASIACLGNIGPGLGVAGPMDGYAAFTATAKVLLTAGMWVGRLEIITVIALLHGHAWRHTSLRGS